MKILTITTLIAGMIATASAQGSSTFQQAVHPHVGRLVFVADHTPVEKHGRLIDVNDSSLTLMGDDGTKIMLAANDVVRIDILSRPIERGLIIGAIGGAAIGLNHTPTGASRGEGIVGWTGLAALLGAGVNQLFPSRRMIYLR